MNADVLFITGHQMGKDKLTGQYTASGASARLRVILPAFELPKYGIHPIVHSVRNGNLNALMAVLEENRPSVVIVSKIFDDVALPGIQRARELGAVIIVDLCDNYLSGGDYFSLTSSLVSMADRITVNTLQMQAKLVSQGVGKEITVIDDLVEGESCKPRVLHAGDSLNLLAFGSKYVCKELDAQLADLSALAKKVRLNLEIVTTLDEETFRWIYQAQERYLTDAFRISLTMWHENILKQMFSRADLVLIPSSVSAFNETKSPNRCMQSIWSGIPVVAFPLPSYLPFREFCLLNESMAQGIEAARLISDWEDRIELGQRFIESLYTPSAVGQKWAREIFNAKESR
jgi:hypothetical protein